jgi:hypothetical protein
MRRLFLHLLSLSVYTCISIRIYLYMFIGSVGLHAACSIFRGGRQIECKSSRGTYPIPPITAITPTTQITPITRDVRYPPITRDMARGRIDACHMRRSMNAYLPRYHETHDAHDNQIDILLFLLLLLLLIPLRYARSVDKNGRLRGD